MRLRSSTRSLRLTSHRHRSTLKLATRRVTLFFSCTIRRHLPLSLVARFLSLLLARITRRVTQTGKDWFARSVTRTSALSRHPSLPLFLHILWVATYYDRAVGMVHQIICHRPQNCATYFSQTSCASDYHCCLLLFCYATDYFARFASWCSKYTRELKNWRTVS